MTAIVLPDLNQKTIDEVRERISNLAAVDLRKVELPQLQEVGKHVGKNADQAIDRMLGRSRTPIWPWIAAGIGLVAVVGVVTAWFAYLRRPTWLERGAPKVDRTLPTPTDDIASAENEGMTRTSSIPTAMSMPTAVGYPIEEA